MADLTERLGNFNPFSKSRRHREDPEDVGEEIDNSTVAGGGHSARQSDLSKSQLRVSNALKSFLVDKNILSESAAGLDVEDHPPPLRNLVTRSHIHVPAEVIDRSHPLPEYFISSSHNTYLMAHQLYGTSSVTAYETALGTGSRCVEIDAWDGDDNKDEPKVTHGYTLVSNLSFRSVCETIRDVVDKEAAESANAQGYRAAPILLSLENHCDPHGQKRLVDIMREVWGPRLLSKAVRDQGHEEQAGGEHVTLGDLGSKIAVIVEYHLPTEISDSDSSSSDSEDSEDEKEARKKYKDKKKTAASAGIIPELAELGVYAQSVKPSDNSWYTGAQLTNGPHHHLINVSESGLAAHLPANSEAIARHNAHHLMRVFPKGTRISSTNLKPVAYWGIGAQICALNCQNFGTSNQLNEALFSGSDGYVLKPQALRAGGNGKLNTGRMKKLRLHVAGATDIPLHGDSEADGIKPYLTCTLYHPDDLKNDTPKRKTSPYKQHKLGFLHRGENPPPTDPIWDETLEWEYEDNELVFVRLLIKSDDSWTRNPMFAVAAVRLQYLVPGWSFIRMLDMKGGETKCSVLVNFEIVDA
ncbi:Fc.00g094800.m01.CDS01 [Cosmosporella sp. VM-42]